jgi:transposase
MHALLARANVHPPLKTLFGPRGRRYLAGLDLGLSGNLARDELLRRLEHYGREIAAFDAHLEAVASEFPETEALEVLHGIGRYSALLVVAEIGEPERFRNGRQVGAYAGLTARVSRRAGIGQDRASRRHLEARIAVAAVDSGAGGDQVGAARRAAGELLPADPQTVGPESRRAGIAWPWHESWPASPPRRPARPTGVG